MDFRYYGDNSLFCRQSLAAILSVLGLWLQRTYEDILFVVGCCQVVVHFFCFGAMMRGRVSSVSVTLSVVSDTFVVPRYVAAAPPDRTDNSRTSPSLSNIRESSQISRPNLISYLIAVIEIIVLQEDSMT